MSVLGKMWEGDGRFNLRKINFIYLIIHSISISLKYKRLSVATLFYIRKNLIVHGENTVFSACFNCHI